MTIALICKLSYAFVSFIVLGIFLEKDADEYDFPGAALFSLIWPVTAAIYFGGKIEKYFR